MPINWNADPANPHLSVLMTRKPAPGLPGYAEEVFVTGHYTDVALIEEIATGLGGSAVTASGTPCFMLEARQAHQAARLLTSRFDDVSCEKDMTRFVATLQSAHAENLDLFIGDMG
jgi:hypothetical protein